MNNLVRNLSPETSLSELFGCLEIFGNVTGVIISTDKVEGESRASGFVEMPSREHNLAAIEACSVRNWAGTC